MRGSSLQFNPIDEGPILYVAFVQDMQQIGTATARLIVDKIASCTFTTFQERISRIQQTLCLNDASC